VFSSKTAAWLALVAVLLFAALITLQVMEHMKYAADPSVWPKVH
jgi:hypothetical protein